MEFEKLRDIIVEVLNVDETEVTMESTFIDDLGADSLDAVSYTHLDVYKRQAYG